MVALNIGELARQVGLQSSAIRYYESIGLMPPPPRASGWRRYDAHALNRLQVIKAARDVGFTIAEIAMLLNGFPSGTAPSQRWKKLAEKKLPEIDELLARATALRDLVRAGMACTCGEIEICLGSKGHTCAPQAHVCEEGLDCTCGH
ncbi:MAG TPA: MerR family transcriptional regulator [Anaerolineales bacterium]|nr:MerR family transcriptional regulator [Anaerolineales bacterium]